MKVLLSDSLDHDFLLEALKKITHRVETVADKNQLNYNRLSSGSIV